MAELNYVPNAQARAMRLQRTGTIGVVSGKIKTPFFPQLIDAIGSNIADRNLRMVLWNSEENRGEPAALETIRSGLLDGLIFTSARPHSATLHQVAELGIPFVLVNRTVDELECDKVTSDNEAGGRQVAQYFIANGRHQVAIVGSSSDLSTVRARRKGFVDEFTRQGIPLRPEWQTQGDEPYTHDLALEAAVPILAAEDHPDAVFCLGDPNGFGVLDAARRTHRVVPTDVWVVGYDDTEMCSWESFDLSSVRQPVDDMARVAVELLVRRIAEPDAPFIDHRFASNLIVRGSTGNVPLKSTQ
ncbi:MAG: binding protein/LacI transcriptional regulator [Subtercola sp.]|nr:binding protein/LacI transcriptional regulator [Subtercola sp.]